MPRRPSPRAFTLIELLASIAVIAILSALGFVGFQKARDDADKATCLSNLRQLGIIHLSYAADHRGTIPMAYQAKRNPSPWWYWIYYDQGYFPEAPSTADKPDSLKLLKSPALVRNADTWVDNTYMHMKQDNVANATDSDLVLATLSRPASHILDITGGLKAGAHRPDAMTRYSAIQAANPATGSAYFVYDGRANVLFADGHVDSLRKEQITLEMCLRQ